MKVQARGVKSLGRFVCLSHPTPHDSVEICNGGHRSLRDARAHCRKMNAPTVGRFASPKRGARVIGRVILASNVTEELVLWRLSKSRVNLGIRRVRDGADRAELLYYRSYDTDSIIFVLLQSVPSIGSWEIIVPDLYELLAVELSARSLVGEEKR